MIDESRTSRDRDWLFSICSGGLHVSEVTIRFVSPLTNKSVSCHEVEFCGVSWRLLQRHDREDGVIWQTGGSLSYITCVGRPVYLSVNQMWWDRCLTERDRIGHFNPCSHCFGDNPKIAICFLVMRMDETLLAGDSKSLCLSLS